MSAASPKELGNKQREEGSTKSNFDVYLERAYWCSQIALAVVASVAAWAAFRQLAAYKLFELLKFVESTEFRMARRVVLREIYKHKDEEWWDHQHHGDEWEKAASIVCAGYNILSLMIEYDTTLAKSPRYKTFFIRYWSRSIWRNHEALETFLKYRRKANSNTYEAFTRLAEQAREFANPTMSFQPK